MRRPWNLVNVPVYSLATYRGDKVNMNVATYVMPVSMDPKLYLMGLYYGTRSLENMQQSDRAVLQIMGQGHKKLIRPLGKRSGMSYDKHTYLDKYKWLTEWNGYTVLKDCAALLELEKLGHQDIGGDHELFWFSVKKFRSFYDEGILYFQDLTNDKIIL